MERAEQNETCGGAYMQHPVDQARPSAASLFMTGDDGFVTYLIVELKFDDK